MLSRGVLVLAALALLGPGLAQAGAPSIVVSPPPGAYATTQAFDLVLVVNPAGLGVLGGSITLDGVEITDVVVACGRIGTLGSGRVTLRCPGITGALLGAGIHTLRVRLDLSDGSTAQGGAVWEILAATGP